MQSFRAYKTPFLFLFIATPGLCLEPGVVATFIESDIGSGAGHAISGDGSRVVFESGADITGGNADLNNELFLWDRTSGFQQLTMTTGQTSYWQVDIDMNGSTVAVVARADITNVGSTRTELYRWSGGVWSRLTVTPGAFDQVFISGMAISDDGNRILLTSRGDYTGTNPSGEEQIWLWQPFFGFDQLTNASPCGAGGGNFGRDLSGDGNRVLFASRCQFSPSINTDLNTDLFLYDALTTNITPLTDEPAAVIALGSLNQDGTRAAIRSGTDLVNGGSGSGTHLFRWVEGSGFEQLSTERVAQDAPAISANGQRIAFVAENGQGSGANPEGTAEIFLWNDGAIRILTDSAQNDAFFGNAQPRVAASGTRISMVALRAFDLPDDSRVGYFVLELTEIFADSFE